MWRKQQVEEWQKAVPHAPPAPYLHSLAARTGDGSQPLPSLVASSSEESKPELNAAEGVSKAAAVVAALQSRVLRQAPGNAAVVGPPPGVPGHPCAASAVQQQQMAAAAGGASAEMQAAQAQAAAHAAAIGAMPHTGAMPPGGMMMQQMPGMPPGAFVACGAQPMAVQGGQMATLPDGTVGYIPDMMGGMPMGAAMLGVGRPMHVAGRGGASTKNCIHPGCTKGAIGKLRLCIAHGGGKRCSYQGCNKAAQGQKPLCKSHGGGRRCKFEGCPRSARDRTDLCIGHGGGKRCCYVGCQTSARSGTMYCSLHDGVVKKTVPPPGGVVVPATYTVMPDGTQQVNYG